MAVRRIRLSRNLLKSQTRKHVLRDLRPYLCTFPDCENSMWTYKSNFGYRRHERDQHEFKQRFYTTPNGPRTEERTNSRVCVFCGERTCGEKTLTDYDRCHHVGRHMEEIAFTVISKPYEDWDFYSDSSSAKTFPPSGRAFDY